MNNTSALVIFGKEFPDKSNGWWKKFDTLVASASCEAFAEEHGLHFVNISELTGAGSIREASIFAEELSRLTLPDGSNLTKTCLYEGYEVWWIHYDSLFLYYCLPYTQYKYLLEYLRNFERVYLYQPPYKSLISLYLEAYGCSVTLVRELGIKSPSLLPFGVFLQMVITIFSVLILMLRRKHTMLFTGDKFQKGYDYDARMRFMYKELRARNIPFVEFVRSLESWWIVLRHAWTRRRPVIYSEAITFAGRFCSLLSGGHRRDLNKFSSHILSSITDPDRRFKLLVATRPFFIASDDMWTIRIMKWILRAIGVRVTCITAATERSWHTIIGCKLNAIPTIGILHGVASRYYNVYDFMPGFDGEKMLSVDKYGLWSEWWREYYLKNSRAYRSEQLYVSGLMRPLENSSANHSIQIESTKRPLRVLFVSEQVAVPEEVLPYLLALLDTKELSVYVTFRPYRDGFETWLRDNRPEILGRLSSDHILRSGIADAISKCDIVVGSYSTSVIEALLQLKPFILFNTNKWGDYYDMKNIESPDTFFAETPEELIDCILKSREIPIEMLEKLQKRFFGDPHVNGSKWVVDQAEQVLLNNSPLVR